MITVKRNDREPPVAATLKADGAAYDLTSCTVKFIMRNKATGVVTVNASATILGALAGTVRYDWGASDTATAGAYDAEFEVTKPGGNKLTFPNGRHLEVMILEDLA